MSAPSDLRRRLEAEARALGFTLFGVAAPDRTDHATFYRRWLDERRHGEMGYLAREDSVARRVDLDKTMPGVASVVVVADEYYGADDPDLVADPSVGIIARYARGRDYHSVVKKKLVKLGRRLDALVDGGATSRAYVDTGPILERDLARRAGLGWFGRNTMIIHPRRGSYFFLGVLLVDVDLPPDPPFAADHCGTCRACLDACPTGALLGRDETGAPVIDARRCISYLTIETRGPIPEALRPAIGNRVYGCDICQEVCPFNIRFANPGAEPGYAPRGPGERPHGVQALPGEDPSTETHPGTSSPSLVELMRMTREEWDAFSRGSAIRRAGYEGFRRNVAVAMGNWLAGLDGEPPEEAITVLREALEDESALVREHAGWALRAAVGSAAGG